MGVVDSDLNERYVKTVKISQMKFGNGLLAGCGLSHWSSRLRQLGRIIIRERVTEHFFMELIRDFKEQVIIVFNSKLERETTSPVPAGSSVISWLLSKVVITPWSIDN